MERIIIAIAALMLIGCGDLDEDEAQYLNDVMASPVGAAHVCELGVPGIRNYGYWVVARGEPEWNRVCDATSSVDCPSYACAGLR